jgi:hypothetical protein
MRIIGLAAIWLSSAVALSPRGAFLTQATQLARAVPVQSRTISCTLQEQSGGLVPSLARRSALGTAAAAVIAIGAPELAFASGGATAGKYTTIPIAKRRYFGRVKQGVYEFMNMGGAIAKGDVGSEDITNFFAQTIKTQSQRQKSNCRGDATACNVKEQFESRWDDMQLSMFLLGNAFRLDSGKPPEKVRQVKEAKAFFSEVEKLQKASKAGSRKDALLRYANAREALDVFLNDVELPPTDDPVYLDTADEKVPSLCQGSFCI